MMKVSMNRKELEKLGVEGGLLKPRAPYDGRMAWPIILGDGQYLIVKGIEKGNIDYLKPKCKVLYYGPYFTWEKSYEGAAVYDSILSALESVVKGQKLELASDVPVGLYNMLRDKFDVSVEEKVNGVKVNLYEAKASAVDEYMGEVGSSIKETALEIIGNLNLEAEDAGYIEKVFSKPYKAFAPLKSLLGEVDSILCSSPVNVGLLTGIRLQDIDENTYAVYNKDKDRIYILTPKKLKDYSHISLVDENVKLEDVFGDLLTGVVGIEEEDLRVRDYGQIKNETIGISLALREWREAVLYLGLPFLIIAAYVTRHSQERALEYLQDNLGITEMQLYNYYKNCLEDVANSLNLPDISVKEFFTLIHSGDRSVIPARPADHVITAKSNSVKIDSGVILLYRGVLRGLSDLARTLPLSSEAKGFYEMLKKIIREVVIPGISPGKRACDVWRTAIDGLKENLGEIRASGLMPEGRSLDEHDSVAGHTLPMETEVAILLRRSHTKFLKEGMVGCAEFHWPYNRHAIGFEDSWIIGPNKGINFTS